MPQANQQTDKPNVSPIVSYVSSGGYTVGQRTLGGTITSVSRLNDSEHVYVQFEPSEEDKPKT